MMLSLASQLLISSCWSSNRSSRKATSMERKIDEMPPSIENVDCRCRIIRGRSTENLTRSLILLAIQPRKMFKEQSYLDQMTSLFKALSTVCTQVNITFNEWALRAIWGILATQKSLHSIDIKDTANTAHQIIEKAMVMVIVVLWRGLGATCYQLTNSIDGKGFRNSNTFRSDLSRKRVSDRLWTCATCMAHIYKDDEAQTNNSNDNINRHRSSQWQWW